MSPPAQFVVRWPSRLLSPESKADSGQRAAVAAKARKAAFHGARRAAPLANPPPGGGAVLEFVFVPPTRRRYSVRNLLKLMTPTLDGIADYLGIDPALLRTHARISPAPTPGGAVLVKLNF